ncbi:MAG: 5'-methylthioadenosine/S-adenosylhomocysteine nucleosidase [Rhizobiaceae bacterium]|nr:5'-methylthioadenosine/S-adenosylhomocysteine nucleosidase [Rhizobiaceae bacterium]
MPPLATLAGRKILFVMAADAEYGPKLKSIFTPLITGVGPVEAGISITRTLAEMQAGGLPDLVVSLGSAGSRRLKRAEVYQVTSVSYRDMDASAFGFEKGITPFLDLPATLPLPVRIPGVQEATLSTGASVVAGSSFDAIEEDMVDMETFACLRACQHFAVPLVGLRGISDGDSDVEHIGDWLEYLHVIDERLAEAVGKLEAAMADGVIRL